MNLIEQIEAQVRRYLVGACTLGELHFALSDFDQAALDAARGGDTRAERMVASAGLLVDEWRLGHRSIESVWHNLSALVSPRPQFMQVADAATIRAANAVTITSAVSLAGATFTYSHDLLLAGTVNQSGALAGATSPAALGETLLGGER